MRVSWLAPAAASAALFAGGWVQARTTTKPAKAEPAAHGTPTWSKPETKAEAKPEKRSAPRRTTEKKTETKSEPKPEAKTVVLECYPACRDGFVCARGSCVSLCNPPCASDQICVDDGKRCEQLPTPSSQSLPPQSSSTSATPPAPTATPVEPVVAPVEPPIPEPAPPRRKPFYERSYSGLGFHLGLGGSVDQNGSKYTLDSTLGFNIRSDIPISKYFVIGPLFQFAAWRPQAVGLSLSRSYYVDLDLYLRARIPVESESLPIEFWLGAPVGVSLNFLSDPRPAVQNTFSVGWNFGGLIGTALHLRQGFGVFLEGGAAQHRTSYDGAQGARVSLVISQFNFNAGFTFRN